MSNRWADKPVGLHDPGAGADRCGHPSRCLACGRPVRWDGRLWRADIDGLAAEIACYPEYQTTEETTT